MTTQAHLYPPRPAIRRVAALAQFTYARHAAQAELFNVGREALANLAKHALPAIPGPTLR